MLPEISRRCLACGAAGRAGARFCPQCGNPLAAEGGDAPAAGREGQGDGRAGAEPHALDREVSGRPAANVPPTRTAQAWAEDDEEPLDLGPTRETVALTREAVGPTRETPASTFAGEVAGRPEPGSSGADARASAGGSNAPHAAGASHAAFAPGFASGGAADERGAAGERAGAAAGEGGAGRSKRAAARVRETVMPRVEKMRDEALVVLEETPDDSGLRFVVIAVALFALFLLFLFLSTTVLR